MQGTLWLLAGVSLLHLQASSTERTYEGFAVAADSYNVVFAGRSGTGKSSLVNALLGLDPESRNGAAVGETETTAAVRSYTAADLPGLTFWDTPGGGTLAHPELGYFCEHGLYAHDLILIVLSDRLSELDLAIAERATEYGIPFAFVRSRSDVSLDSRARRAAFRALPRSRLKADFRREVVRNLATQTSDLGRGVFVVSSLVLDGTLSECRYGIDEDKLKILVRSKP